MHAPRLCSRHRPGQVLGGDSEKSQKISHTHKYGEGCPKEGGGVVFLAATSGDDIKHAYLRCLGLDGLLLLLPPLHIVHSGQRGHYVDVD